MKYVNFYWCNFMSHKSCICFCNNRRLCFCMFHVFCWFASIVYVLMFSPEGDTSVAPAQIQTRPIHKWPLRPGVLVHVNGTHSLSVGRLPQQQCSGAVNSSTPKSTPTRPNISVPKHNMCKKDRIKRAAKRLKRRRAASVANLQPDDTNQHSRANRIRQMFLNDANKYQCETLPGIIHGKSGGKQTFLYIRSYCSKSDLPS